MAEDEAREAKQREFNNNPNTDDNTTSNGEAIENQREEKRPASQLQLIEKKPAIEPPAPNHIGPGATSQGFPDHSLFSGVPGPNNLDPQLAGPANWGTPSSYPAPPAPSYSTPPAPSCPAPPAPQAGNVTEGQDSGEFDVDDEFFAEYLDEPALAEHPEGYLDYPAGPQQ